MTPTDRSPYVTEVMESPWILNQKLLNAGMSRSDPRHRYLSDIGPVRWIGYRRGVNNTIRFAQHVTVITTVVTNLAHEHES